MQGDAWIVATLPKDFQALGYSANTFRNQCFREAACVRRGLAVGEKSHGQETGDSRVGLMVG